MARPGTRYLIVINLKSKEGEEIRYPTAAPEAQLSG